MEKAESPTRKQRRSAKVGGSGSLAANSRELKKRAGAQRSGPLSIWAMPGLARVTPRKEFGEATAREAFPGPKSCL
jgi:hypothetical protein